MTYATTLILLDRFSAEEIAQRADRGMPRLVSAAMLQTAASGGSMSGYTADEQASTAAALAVVNQKLMDADSVIDGYLMGRYTTPLAVVPRLVIGIECDLARYALYDDIATEQITQRYKDAVKLLEAIGKGSVNLGANDNQVPAQDIAAVTYTAPDKVFTSAALEGY